MPDTIEEQIEDSALKPKRARGDMGEVEQHPLKDQIAADKYLLNKERFTPGSGNKVKIPTMRIVPPGGNGNE